MKNSYAYKQAYTVTRAARLFFIFMRILYHLYTKVCKSGNPDGNSKNTVFKNKISTHIPT